MSGSVKIIEGLDDAINGRKNDIVVIPFDDKKPLKYWEKLFPCCQIIKNKYLPTEPPK